MIKFDKFRADSIFQYESRNCLVSEQFFKDLIKDNRSFCVLIASNKDQMISCIESVSDRKFYSLLVQSGSNIVNGLVFVQKNNERDTEFKESINKVLQANRDVGVIYRGHTELKVLKEMKSEVYGVEKENYDFFNINISRILNKSSKILGIEIPIDESVVKTYKSIGFLVPSSLLVEDARSLK